MSLNISSTPCLVWRKLSSSLSISSSPCLMSSLVRRKPVSCAPLLYSVCSSSLSPLCLHTQLLVSPPCISGLYLHCWGAGGVHGGAQGGGGGGGHGLEPFVAPLVGHVSCLKVCRI